MNFHLMNYLGLQLISVSCEQRVELCNSWCIYIFMMYKLTACSCWLLSQLTEELQHQLFNGPFSFMSNFNPCPSNIDQFQSCLHHRLWNKGISIANWGVLNFYNCTYNLFYSETSTTESALLQSTLLGWSD